MPIAQAAVPLADRTLTFTLQQWAVLHTIIPVELLPRWLTGVARRNTEASSQHTGESIVGDRGDADDRGDDLADTVAALLALGALVPADGADSAALSSQSSEHKSVASPLPMTVAPEIVNLFELANRASHVIHVESWQGMSATRAALTVHRGVCCEFRLTTGPQTSGRVALVVHPAAGLGAVLAALLSPELSTEAAVADAPPRGASLGLVESQSVIQALRLGDPRVLQTLVSSLHCADYLALVAPFAGGIPGGFTLQTVDSAGSLRVPSQYFQSHDGKWLATELLAEPAPTRPHPNDLLTSGRLRITRVGRRDILADIHRCALEALTHVA